MLTFEVQLPVKQRSMHKVKKVSIENFRSCKSVTVQLSAFSPLVGYNNAGKSNIMEAIHWGIHHSALNEQHFCDNDEQVCVTVHVEGVDEQVVNSLSKNRRNRIQPYLEDGGLTFRRTQPKPNSAKGGITLEVYMHDPEDEEEEEGWKEDPHGLNAIIQTLFPEPIQIGAMEDAGEDVSRSKRGSTISRLIGEVLRPSSDDFGTPLNGPLSDLKGKVTADGDDRLPELDEFDEAASRIISQFFPGLKIRTHIPIPDVEDLFGDGTIRVEEEGDDEQRDVSSLGHGAQRSIQMALLRRLADERPSRNTDAACKLVFIDEPELYLHPQAVETVRKSLKDLSGEGYQVVFATHSPLMIGEDDIPYASVIQKKKDEGTKVRTRVVEAVKDVIDDARSQRKTLFNLNNASRILFADRVLVMEGKAEKRLLPRIFETVKETTLREARVALVSVNGAGSIPKSVEILKTMGMNVKALVDLDFAFNLAPKNDLLDDDDGDVRACRDNHNGNSSNLHAAQEARELASSGVATQEIRNIHNKLRRKDYWIWTDGAFEAHLGIEDKNEEEWAEFVGEMEENGFDETVEDPVTVRNLVDWIA